MSENANVGKVFNITGGGGGSGALKLVSISVKTLPTKKIYKSGESFDPAGMIVEADYGFGLTSEVTGYSCTPTVLTDGTTEVTITYTENRVTKTTTTPVTVEKALTGIAVTTNPTKMAYNYLEKFAPAGMVLTATFSDGSTEPVGGYSYPTTQFETLGSQTVELSYTYEGVTKTTTLNVTVNAIQVAVPTQSGSVSYDGTVKAPTWDSSYDSAKMSVSHDTTGVNAGDYTVTFDLIYGYVFPNGTRQATATWTIDRQTIAALPTQSNVLVADGTQKTPEWNGFVNGQLTKGGDFFGTAAKDYTMTFTPTANYKWWDGSVGAKDATWTITSVLVTIPTQKNVPTYAAGVSRTPEWDDFDSENSQVNVTSRIDAGTYTATFSLLRGMWTDGTTADKTVNWTIERAMLSAVPAQVNASALKYDGNPKTPSWDSNYDSAKMTVEVTPQTLAGSSYSASFTPTANYKWADGSTGTKTATWAIAKGDNSLTLSPSTVTLNSAAKTASITASRLGNGTITATSDNTNVAKVKSINQNTGEIVIESVNDTSGTATITVKVAEGDNYAACTDQTSAVKASFREYLYGFDINLSDSNPATRVSYPSDVDNAGFTAAKMNFGGAFSYGSWPSTPGEKFMPRPCMLKFDGTVGYYLNPNDYTKKADGTASDVANVNYGGNAMMEWPKIYVKRWESNGVYHFRCSDVKVDSDYECWSNYDKNNKEIPHFYTPIYFGSKDSSNRMRSISGQANSVSTTAQNEIDYAKANGADIWYTEVVADRFLEQDLLVMMFKSTDLQVTLGYGRCKSGNSNAIAPGTMNDKGMFWGSNDQTSGVKAFGMENPWGNLWRRHAGWMLVNNEHKVKLTRGTKDGSTATDYNTDGSGYLATGVSISSNGYISGMATKAYGRLPNAVAGSATTYEADYLWQNSGTRYALCGGYWCHDLADGPFCVALYGVASYSHAAIGAALSCKPLAAA